GNAPAFAHHSVALRRARGAVGRPRRHRSAGAAHRALLNRRSVGRRKRLAHARAAFAHARQIRTAHSTLARASGNTAPTEDRRKPDDARERDRASVRIRPALAKGRRAGGDADRRDLALAKAGGIAEGVVLHLAFTPSTPSPTMRVLKPARWRRLATSVGTSRRLVSLLGVPT